MAQRHFPYQHPTFGTKLKPKSASYWERSVYYWWYEYLKRNNDYRLTCENGGKGKLAGLYEEFGDVYASNFKDWWTEDGRGVKLFAEPVVNHDLIELTQPLTADDLSNPDLIYLQVPKNLPKRYLKQQFDKIIRKYHSGKRGDTYARRKRQGDFKERYKVQGQPNIPALRIALSVHDYRKEHPELTLYQIGKDLKLFQKEQLVLPTDFRKDASDKRNVVAATVSRYLRVARNMIDNVALGKFPDAKKPSIN